MTYPIKLNIRDIEIENVVDSLIKNSYFATRDKGLVRKVGHKLKKERKNGKLITGYDRATGETVLVLRKSPLGLPENVTKVKGRSVQYEFDDFYFF